MKTFKQFVGKKIPFPAVNKGNVDNNTPDYSGNPIKEMIENQEPLGREFEKVLYDNAWSLYVRS